MVTPRTASIKRPRPRRRPLAALALATLLFGAVDAGAVQPDESATLAQGAELAAAVCALADARLALMPAVAAAKLQSGQPVTDAAREASVIRSAGERADAVGLARAPVEALFELQVRLARELQESLHAHWRRDGYDAARPAASLSGELRPRLDELTGALLQALYLAAPSLATVDLQAVAARALPAPRWSAPARAQFVATLSEMRLAGPRSPARARAAGVLRIGTPADYAPFSALADGRLRGSDVALGMRLAAALGLRPVFIASRWATLLDDLEADRFDIALGGISVTDVRRSRAAFSLPLARGGKTAIGRCRDRPTLHDWDAIDQPGVRVIENVGGTNEAFVRRQLRHATVQLHPDNRTVFAELTDGRADVMFTDDTEVALASHRHPELCRLLPELYEPTDKSIMLPHDGLWTGAVDDWLRRALSDAVPAALLQQYLQE